MHPKLVVVNVFSQLEAQSISMQSSMDIDAHNQQLSMSKKASLCQHAITAALLCMKQRCNGRFGISRVEARLDVCLPFICGSCARMMRHAINRHLQSCACQQLECDPADMENALFLRTCSTLSNLLIKQSVQKYPCDSLEECDSPVGMIAITSSMEPSQSQLEHRSTSQVNILRSRAQVDAVLERRHAAYNGIQPVGVQDTKSFQIM
eukprot:303980-Chlamydomonas_euryale.AAC.22